MAHPRGKGRNVSHQMVNSLFQMMKVSSSCQRIELNYLAGGGLNPHAGPGWPPFACTSCPATVFVRLSSQFGFPAGLGDPGGSDSCSPDPLWDGSRAGSVPGGAGSRPLRPQHPVARPGQRGSLILLKVPSYINFHFKLRRVYYKVTPLAF